MKKLVSELKPHPHQNLVPAMSNSEYQDLLNDIKQNGILQPIDIKYDGTILDGHHRYKAAKELGIKEVEVRIPELVDISEDEYLLSVALNRRHLSEGQKAVLANEYRKVISEKAIKEKLEKARAIKSGIMPNSSMGDNVTSKDNKPQEKSRKFASEKFHISERKVREVAEIDKKAENNSTAKDVYEKLKTGELELHEAKTIMRQPESIREVVLQKKEENPKKDIRAIVKEVNNREKLVNNPKPPEGKYQIIYADPPWKFEYSDQLVRDVERHYPTMDIDEIKAIKVPVADEAILFLWTPAMKVKEALEVMEAWGFTYRTHIVWEKDTIGTGWYVRTKHELLLIGRKGNVPFPAPENRPQSVINAPNQPEHSQKPEIFYDLIEKMYPNYNRIELFARNKRDGWVVWGNDVNDKSI